MNNYASDLLQQPHPKNLLLLGLALLRETTLIISPFKNVFSLHANV